METGKCGTLDLSYVKQHYIDSKVLTGANFKAADFDGNGTISTLDISKMKLEIIK